MPQTSKPLYLPVLPSTKRRTALIRSSGPLRVGPGWAQSRPAAKARRAGRYPYAAAAVVLAVGVVLINGLVVFSILRDRAYLSQPESKIGTPLQP